MVEAASNLKTINFYLIENWTSLMLVDAGLNNEDNRKALHTVLQNNGFFLEDLTEIVLTHNHVDHVGLVNWITENHPIPVYASNEAIPRLKRDSEFLEMRLVFFTKLYRMMGCGEAGDKQAAHLKQAIEKNSSQSIKPDVEPIEKEHNGFTVINVPGHAPDQIALFDQHEREVFAGDLLIEHISSNALIEPDYSGRCLPAVSQHKASLENILDLNVKKLYSGHGNIIENPVELLKKRLAGIDRKADRIKKLIIDGHTTGSQIAKAYYGKIYHTQFSLVMSEIIGHLDYLEKRHQITKKMKNGIWHYAAEPL
jgi:glyoxylase-like metal-dependent hydrolase (beta-lactamase superfamily II)